MIISLIASKGGTGKTTTALYLACAAKKASPDMTVTVLDADPQRSALDWATDAAAASDPLPFDVLPADADTIDALEGHEGELVVIDTAPGFDTSMRSIIDRSDVCIIPTSPNPLDVRRAWKTVDVCDGKAVILVTKANMRTVNFRQTLESLNGDGDVSFFDSVVRNSVRYAQAFGTNPRKLYDYADVWQELKEAL